MWTKIGLMWMTHESYYIANYSNIFGFIKTQDVAKFGFSPVLATNTTYFLIYNRYINFAKLELSIHCKHARVARRARLVN